MTALSFRKAIAFVHVSSMINMCRKKWLNQLSVQGTAFEKQISRKLWNMLLVLPVPNHVNSVHAVTSIFFNTHLNPFPFTYNTVYTCMVFPRHSLGAILFFILVCFTVGLSFTLQFFQFLWMIVDGRKWYFSVLDWLRKKWRGLGILVNFCDMASGLILFKLAV